MKNFYKLLTLLSILTVVSCHKEEPYNPNQAVRLPFRAFCIPLNSPFGQESETKSSFADESLERISNLNYYLFRNGDLVGQEYFANCTDMHITLPSATDSYNLYILANTGQQHINPATKEADMGTAVHIDYFSKDNYHAIISAYGFPMSTKIKDFTAESILTFSLRRLVHTLYVKVNTDKLTTTEMEFTGLSIKQAPRDVFPFAEQSKARFAIDGDGENLSDEDLRRLNAGEVVALYLLENMRGTLLPGNTDWKTKIPDRIPSDHEKSLASYIELTARAKTITAEYENNIYRAYLGTGPSDFNVRRNTFFTLTNNFTNDMIVNEGWRVESDTPNITSKLAFVDTRYTKATAPYPDDTGDSPHRPFKDLEGLYLMDKFSHIFFIYRSDPKIEYDFTLENTNPESSDYKDYITYKTSKIDEYFTAVAVTGTYPIDYSGPYYQENPELDKGKSVTFRLRSKDGILEDKLICRALTYPLGLKIQYDGVPSGTPVTDEGKLNIYFCNPLKLQLRAEVLGNIYGSCKSGSKEKTYSIVINTGNKYSSSSYGQTYGYSGGYTPKTWEPFRIDRYDDKSLIKEIGGFYEYFRMIWDKTYNDKHAHPTKITFNIDLSFSSNSLYRAFPHHFETEDDFKLPVHFVNKELTKSSGGAYYGGGTDIGLIWHQYDYSSATSYTTYKFLRSTSSPGSSYYNEKNELPIEVKINDTQKWTTEGTVIRPQNRYSQSYFKDLGFDTVP